MQGTFEADNHAGVNFESISDANGKPETSNKGADGDSKEAKENEATEGVNGDSKGEAKSGVISAKKDKDGDDDEDEDDE